ncbi:S9 family peptidase [Marinobacter sp. SS21]|uniref:S9 family peptidase n=1 Tax=Marinobacter sp. SS21 TaxID=2979460 RepID=UPI00232B22B4|nr:prolyl oligopeptidase family serine peptidase [Marinobacter sp. SS21]MDC0663145.1 prolyl oligopeptidase family serine peptidase [Marinobacter sp. SS21]
MDSVAVLTPQSAAAAQLERETLRASAAGLFWLQLDPRTGACGLWRYLHSDARCLTPAGYGLRSRVNGYGGGAMCAFDTLVYGVNAETQQIDRIDPETGGVAPLTRTEGARYGGLVADVAGARILAVREWPDAAGQRPDQELVAVTQDGRITVLHAGADFYSAPAVSADGRRIAWVSWTLPAMPWQESTLWTAALSPGGPLRQARPVPSPQPASVQQPSFAGDRLCVLSDHRGWWQPYRVDGLDAPCWTALAGQALDHANAPWQLAEAHHQALPEGGWARVCYRQGQGELWLCRQAGAQPRQVGADYTDFRSLQVYRGQLYGLASRADAAVSVVRLDLESTDGLAVLAGGERLLAPGQVSLPQRFRLPAASTDLSAPVSGFYYAPSDRTQSGLPPLIVNVHGGPTSAAYPVFNAQVQFWCQHGFAVAEVNYRGSTGAGRAFRLALAGQWGASDVADVGAAARYLVAQGLADGRRLFIQGRSAGGFTALLAMAAGNQFRAGASIFGVSDPARLRQQTHRFESGYLDWLLGEPQQYRERWLARTPVLQAKRMCGPVAFFQGGQDTVVVPEQTERMVAAMAQAGVAAPVQVYPEEGHGFRQQRNQSAMLAALLEFYRQQSMHPDEAPNNLG